MKFISSYDGRPTFLAYRSSGFLLAVVAMIGTPEISHATDVKGNNRQSVTISGAAVNSASSGGNAVMNISTLRGNVSTGSNNQTVVIKGAVLNQASGGAKSTLNIASKDASSPGGNQLISVEGPVVSMGSGSRVNASINIGKP